MPLAPWTISWISVLRAGPVHLPTQGLEGITVDPSFSFLPPIAGGATGHVAMTGTATDDVDSGTFTAPFFVQVPVRWSRTFEGSGRRRAGNPPAKWPAFSS
jgi:hypothetical protein